MDTTEFTTGDTLSGSDRKKRRSTPADPYDALSREMERLMVFDELEGREKAPMGDARKALHDEWVADLRRFRKEAGKNPEGGEPDFFEGLRDHEGAFVRFGAFQSELGNRAAARILEADGQGPPEKTLRRLRDLPPAEINRTMASFTREEVQKMFSEFEGREQLEADEIKALKHYDLAVKEPWRLERTDSTDARVLRNDLLARRAQREPDGATRERLLDELDVELQSVILDLKYSASPEEQLKNVGRRAEYQLMLLVRRWARAAGVDHLVSIEHTLPRDDQKFGIDFALRIGRNVHNLDLKALSPDQYQQEFREKKLEAASQKAAKVRGGVLFIESDRLRQAYEDELAGKRGVGRRHVFERLTGSVFEDDTILIEGLAGPKKPEKKSVPRANERDITNFLVVKKLQELGYLAPGPASDMDAIRNAKIEATEAIKKMKPTKEELSSADFFEKIKRA